MLSRLSPDCYGGSVCLFVRVLVFCLHLCVLPGVRCLHLLSVALLHLLAVVYACLANKLDKRANKPPSW